MPAWEGLQITGQFEGSRQVERYLFILKSRVL
jgi:hypothetical protein